MKAIIQQTIKKAYKRGNTTFEGLVRLIQVEFPNTHTEDDFQLITDFLKTK